MDFMIQMFAFLVTVLVLVTVHEFGHFWVAKRLGIGVRVFSVGFGRAMLKWTRGKTEYRIAWIPLGGYCQMIDEREEEIAPTERHLAFNRRPLWQRTLVVLAGPAINILFAIIAFWLVYTIGVKVAVPVIGEVTPNSIAAKAGLTPSQQILKIDGQPTDNWQKVMLQVVSRMGHHGQMTVQTRPFKKTDPVVTHDLNLTTWKLDDFEPEPLSTLGIKPYRPPVTTVIGSVLKGSPADKAGLRPGDKILELNADSFTNWFKLVREVRDYAGETVPILFERDGKIDSVEVAIGTKWVWRYGKIGYLGVRPLKIVWPEDRQRFVQYPFWYAPWPALKQSWMLWAFHYVVIKKMILGEMSLNSLGGPITIFRIADKAFREGLVQFLNFLAVVSLMLAFANIMPIPGLDGGHLLYYVIEAIRRKPLSPRVETLILRLGIILLIVLIFHVTVNDIVRLL